MFLLLFNIYYFKGFQEHILLGEKNLELKLILIPFTGAFIGYITNYIAIKMLFRPYKAVYLFGFKLPFTPGIIPKEREYIIESIANLVAQQLFTEKKIQKLLKDLNYEKNLEKKVDSFVEKFIEENFEDVKESIKNVLIIGKFNIKGLFFITALEKAINKGLDKTKEKLKTKVKDQIFETIEKELEEEIINISKQLDIKKLVIETLDNLTPQELEKIVLSISGRHFRYINFFGAFLGFLIGLTQVIVFSTGL